MLWLAPAAAPISAPSRAGVTRAGKESAGIQLEPLANTGTPLTTKVNDSPHCVGLAPKLERAQADPVGPGRRAGRPPAGARPRPDRAAGRRVRWATTAPGRRSRGRGPPPDRPAGERHDRGDVDPSVRVLDPHDGLELGLPSPAPPVDLDCPPRSSRDRFERLPTAGRRPAGRRSSPRCGRPARSRCSAAWGPSPSRSGTAPCAGTGAPASWLLGRVEMPLRVQLGPAS